MHDNLIQELYQTDLYKELNEVYSDSPIDFIKKLDSKFNSLIMVSGLILDQEMGNPNLNVLRSFPVTLELYKSVIGYSNEEAYEEILKKLKNDINN